MISILAIIENYWINRYAIERALIACAGTEVELLICSHGEPRITEFLNSLTEGERYPHIIRTGEITELSKIHKAAAYNSLLKESKGDYICVFDCNNMVKKNWLFDLKYYHELIVNSGVAAIPEFVGAKAITPLLDKNDELVNVWCGPDRSVDGIMLFKRDLIDELGGFDERLNGRYFQRQFALRASAIGKENFYIPGQTRMETPAVASTPLKNKEDAAKNKEYEKMLAASLNEMKNRKNYHVTI